MRVGITGSRKFPNKRLVEKVINDLPSDTIIRHGACSNSPDAWADAAAKKRGMRTEALPANWRDLSHPDARIRKSWDGVFYDANAGKRRNADVTAAPEVDEVIGFWDGRSPGTRDALQKAYNAGKPVKWYDPSGGIHEWSQTKTGRK